MMFSSKCCLVFCVVGALCHPHKTPTAIKNGLTCVLVSPPVPFTVPASGFREWGTYQIRIRLLLLSLLLQPRGLLDQVELVIHSDDHFKISTVIKKRPTSFLVGRACPLVLRTASLPIHQRVFGGLLAGLLEHGKLDIH
jgi:hypothetical protein